MGVHTQCEWARCWLSGHMYAIYQIQACTTQIFHPPTYRREARFAHQLDNPILWCAVLKELHINTTNA